MKAILGCECDTASYSTDNLYTPGFSPDTLFTPMYSGKWDFVNHCNNKRPTFNKNRRQQSLFLSTTPCSGKEHFVNLVNPLKLRFTSTIIEYVSSQYYTLQPEITLCSRYNSTVY